jgi:hypothetical protein
MVHMAEGSTGIEMEPLTNSGINERGGSSSDHSAMDSSPRGSSSAPKYPAPLKPAYRVGPLVAAFCLLVIVVYGPGGDMELDGLPVPAARKCLGILVCVSTMWATEAVPHYVTSLLIPMLVVATGTLLPPKGKDCSLRDKACLAERYKPYAPHEAAKEITGQFFDPTVLLFMAGFRLELRHPADPCGACSSHLQA